MIVNLNVKIRTGKRTKPVVEVYYTGSNKPVFINDMESNKDEIASHVMKVVQESFDDLWAIRTEVQFDQN